jgi:hypothetical protein
MIRLVTVAQRGLGLSLVLAALSGAAVASARVPEIDPGSMAGALTLLSSGFLLLTAKRRKK